MKRNADPKAKDAKGRTPLELAIAGRHAAATDAHAERTIDTYNSYDSTTTIYAKIG